MDSKTISDLLYNELYYIYCNNCRYAEEKDNDVACEDCSRKSMLWEILQAECDRLVQLILESGGENE